MLENLRQLFRDVIYVSRVSKVKNKKFIIFKVVIFSNFVVLLDIIIIVILSSLFSSNESNYFFIAFINKNLYIFPFIVVLRFISIYLEKAMIYKLQLDVNENLREFLLNEVYERGNFSISDASFYITKLTEHVAYFYSALATLISSSLQLTLYLIFLLISDTSSVFYFLIVSLFLIYPTYVFLKRGRHYMHESYMYTQNLLKDIERVIENIFLIKILNTKLNEFKIFKKNIEKYTESQFYNFKYGTINYLVPNFVILLVLSLLIAFTNIIRSLTLEFIGVILRLVQTIGVINNNLNMLINSHVHLEKFHEIEKNKSNEKQINLKISKDLNNAIEINNMSFKYFGSNKDLYEGVSLEIKKSKHTVIVGANGSGKSTLLGLLSGVFIPHEGDIIFSSSRMSYVGVTPHIIKGSIKENLLYGNKEKFDDTYLSRMLEEFDIFDNKKISLNDKISNKTLSSGQMQKISLLRAVLSNPDILFLDESTSNLDEKSKDKVTKILKNLECTIVNCTHSPSDFIFDEIIKVEKVNDRSIVSIN